jgi:hypothetical protein
VSATLTHDDGEPVMFKLYYPRDSTDKSLGIHVKFRDAELTARWDEGTASLATIIRNFPEMLRLAGEERKIQEEISSMSAEIDKLLDDTE